MSSVQLGQPAAAHLNEDWLSHKMNFLPLPLIITNLLPRASKRISYDTPTTSSLTAPEQCYFSRAQPSKQQAERPIRPTDIVDTTTETRQPRCSSLPGSYCNLSKVQLKDRTYIWLWLIDNRSRCLEGTVEEFKVVPSFAAVITRQGKTAQTSSLMHLLSSKAFPCSKIPIKFN